MVSLDAAAQSPAATLSSLARCPKQEVMLGKRSRSREAGRSGFPCRKRDLVRAAPRWAEGHQ